MTADLHIHTTASDGLFSCQDVIKEALSAGVDVVSVTDHDTAFNTEEIARLSARAGIKSVNGTEISAYEARSRYIFSHTARTLRTQASNYS